MLTQARGATICDPPRPPISRQLLGFNAPQGSADGSKIRPGVPHRADDGAHLPSLPDSPVVSGAKHPRKGWSSTRCILTTFQNPFLSPRSVSQSHPRPRRPADAKAFLCWLSSDRMMHSTAGQHNAQSLHSANPQLCSTLIR